MMEKTQKTQNRKKAVLPGLLLLILLVLVGMGLVRIQTQLQTARADRDAMTQRVEQQRSINAVLTADLKKAKDENFLTDLARDRLGVVTQDEKVFYDSGR